MIESNAAAHSLYLFKGLLVVLLIIKFAQRRSNVKSAAAMPPTKALSDVLDVRTSVLGVEWHESERVAEIVLGSPTRRFGDETTRVLEYRIEDLFDHESGKLYLRFRRDSLISVRIVLDSIRSRDIASWENRLIAELTTLYGSMDEEGRADMFIGAWRACPVMISLRGGHIDKNSGREAVAIQAVNHKLYDAPEPILEPLISLGLGS